MGSAVAFVLKGYPRLSETFIAQEILGLERRGLDIRIVSLRHPTDKSTHPIHSEISAPVHYLPEYLYQEPGRVFRSWLKARKMPGYRAARAKWLRDLRRDLTPNRIRRFGQACVLAAELPPEVSRLHFHFLHTPASVTRYCAVMTGLPWSGSAHAKDIWTSPDWEIREKLQECDWLVTCTKSGAEHLKGLAPDPDTVALQYHGLDLTRFPATEPKPANSGAVTLVSVGRAVEKKGYDDLIDALAQIPRELDWRLIHIGGGGLLSTLKQQAHRLGIADRIEWRGTRPQADVIDALRSADIFVLASKIAKDGDRDGLPNVLMEAQSQGLAVVATAVSAIPELIKDGETGLLVPPEDAPALSEAIRNLIENSDLRADLAKAGEERVRHAFNAETELDDLIQRFQKEGPGS